MLTLFKRYILLLLIFIGIWLLWGTVFVYPIKLFVVFMHEVSHGLAAVATGGRIVEIRINPQQGGYILAQGGSRFWILTAGYLGSLLSGGIILFLTARPGYEKAIGTLIGVSIVVLTFVFVEGGSPSFFGIHFFKEGNFIVYGDFPSLSSLFCIGFGGALIAISFFLSKTVNDWILQILGTTNCFYIIIDITGWRSDTPLLSDAQMLSDITGIPTEIWGIIWLILTIGGTFLFLYIIGNRPMVGADSSSSREEGGA